MTTLTPIRDHPNPKDAEQVEMLSALGATQEYIANHLRISVNELTDCYPTQLQLGPEEANLRVARVFFDLAVSGKYPVLTLEWMKMKAKWGATQSASTQTPEEIEEETNVAREKLLKLLNRGK